MGKRNRRDANYSSNYYNAVKYYAQTLNQIYFGLLFMANICKS